MATSFAVLLVFAVMLAGCALLASPESFVRTLVRLTPCSADFLSLATEFPAGYLGNILWRLVFLADDNGAADALAEQINALSEIEVEVVLADNQAEAMTLLCTSDTGTVSAAWISGAAYVAAKQCGIASLQAERGTGRVSNTGEAG